MSTDTFTRGQDHPGSVQVTPYGRTAVRAPEGSVEQVHACLSLPAAGTRHRRISHSWRLAPPPRRMKMGGGPSLVATSAPLWCQEPEYKSELTSSSAIGGSVRLRRHPELLPSSTTSRIAEPRTASDRVTVHLRPIFR